mmetsp:Transcript_1291/g.1594  ORF Transcript_1291/g.1594 Transcript_1291/m.1594 type:complete len:114 (+) Transcript_1291:65-406(+)|eukprot:CAMPEP_0170491998 /NCGR_PEP_ID=MMETSP0208-20121228/11507_1 /TAXON_ID=197538 /ORGANISM="Strombidium inclinatum, Strain S3" /LENGTH=113 /DNA_ID=CAMNT_0010767675 /DNA_START=46 /DNA_END=387 /DNA_ORIENTATION=-
MHINFSEDLSVQSANIKLPKLPAQAKCNVFFDFFQIVIMALNMAGLFIYHNRLIYSKKYLDWPMNIRHAYTCYFVGDIIFFTLWILLNLSHVKPYVNLRNEWANSQQDFLSSF